MNNKLGIKSSFSHCIHILNNEELLIRIKI
jgi:hypothetical protein